MSVSRITAYWLYYHPPTPSYQHRYKEYGIIFSCKLKWIKVFSETLFIYWMNKFFIDICSEKEELNQILLWNKLIDDTWLVLMIKDIFNFILCEWKSSIYLMCSICINLINSCLIGCKSQNVKQYPHLHMSHYQADAGEIIIRIIFNL